MSCPILDKNAPWAHGISHSFTLDSDGNFTGYVHPPGEALRHDPSSNVVDNNQMFIRCTNRNMRGRCRGLLCASSNMPFDKYTVGTTFYPQLILVMGISVNLDGTITYHYYKWKGIGSYKSVADAMATLKKPIPYIRETFERTLYKSNHGDIHLAYLNQVSGVTFACLNQQVCVAARKYKVVYYDGIENDNLRVEYDVKIKTDEDKNKVNVTNVFVEQGEAPDRWVPTSSVYPEEKSISFLSLPSEIKNIDIHDTLPAKDDVGIASGTKRILNLTNSRTVVIFTKRKVFPEEYDELVWVPLPMINDDDDDFIHVAGITPEEKSNLDSDIHNNTQLHPNYKMNNNVFRQKLESMSYNNCGEKYVRMRKLVCGGNVEGESVYNYVISTIDEDDIEELESYHNCKRIGDDTFMYIDEKNAQDPYYPGIVIWRIYPLPAKGIYDRTHVDLTRTTLPTSGLNRDCTYHEGHFSMAFLRQSSQSSGALNQVSSPTNHNYNNAKDIDLSLAPFTSALFSTLASQTTVASDQSGQVITGTIKKALKFEDERNNFESRHICPYIIHTSPKFDSTLGCNKSFHNCFHTDPHDSMDRDISCVVLNYVDKCDSPVLQSYYHRLIDRYSDILIMNDKDKTAREPLHSIYGDKNKAARIPLHTTCAYKCIEQPKDKLVVHRQYFILEGMAMDLSSTVFLDPNIEYVANTFLGRIAWHGTSCSTWEDNTNGHVTTLMPGLAGNQGWGSSGGPRYLRAAAGSAERDRLVVDHIERHMQNNNGQVPRYLPGVRITDYFRENRSGAVRLIAPSRSRSNDNRARSQERRGGTTSGSRSTGTRSSRDNGDGNGSNKKNTSTTKAKAKKRKQKSNNKNSKKRRTDNAGSSRNNNRRENNQMEASARRNNISIRETPFSITDLNSIGTYRSDSVSRTMYNDNVTYLNNAVAEVYGYPHDANNVHPPIRQSIDNAVMQSIRADRYTWPPIVSDVFGRIPSTSMARDVPDDDLYSLIRARIVNHFMDPDGGGHIAVSAMNEEDV